MQSKKILFQHIISFSLKWWRYKLQKPLGLRLEIGISSKPNNILAQIGICSVNVLHDNSEEYKEKLKVGEETEGN